MKINYSKVSQSEYEEIIAYLYDNFGRESAVKFSVALIQKLKQIELFPESFSFYQDTNYRKFMVNPYITVVYKVNADLSHVEILNFWFNRSNPEVLLKHL
jgi:plasmid stabilization system protein ParE